MSNIPTNRHELVQLIETHFAKLVAELDNIDETTAQLMCDDDFSIQAILAVRLWWTRAVISWVAAGRQGEIPPIPAAGYNWRETPALNKSIAAAAANASYTEIRQDLVAAKATLMAVITDLSDEELTQVGQFAWAEKWPVMRWISIGTSSQYAGARKLIRKALRSHKTNS